MSTMNRVTVCGFAVVAALSLAACGNQSANTGASNAAPQASAVAGTTSPATNLAITSWGPDSTKAGVVFNKQPDGSAALWFRVNRSLDGDEVSVQFNNVTLRGDISDTLVTVSVPARLYATPGAYKVYVVARKGDQTSQTNVVTFTAQ